MVSGCWLISNCHSVSKACYTHRFKTEVRNKIKTPQYQLTKTQTQRHFAPKTLGFNADTVTKPQWFKNKTETGTAVQV